MTAVGMDGLFLEARPHICYKHDYSTFSQIAWDQHLLSLPHYVTGHDGECTNCHEKVESFLDPITTISESITILCDNCKYKLNRAIETIKMKDVKGTD